MNDLTLIINAGGQSRRMGTDKALLTVQPHGLPLIAHIAARLAPLGVEVPYDGLVVEV